MSTAIHCHNISKAFQAGASTITVLNAVELEVKTGEFMMLMGPSGCGKTTLMSIIAGILQNDSGTCRVLDMLYQNTHNEAVSAFRAQNIGFIFQSFNLIPTLSICENVAIPLIINGAEREGALKHAHDTLIQVGLSEHGQGRPNALSGGQQQRVAIARALVHKPSIVLCDEPTSALDHQTGLSVLDLMKHMNRTLGTTFLVITHDQRIAHYADRIAHMDDGIITHLEVPHHG